MKSTYFQESNAPRHQAEIFVTRNRQGREGWSVHPGGNIYSPERQQRKKAAQQTERVQEECRESNMGEVSVSPICNVVCGAGEETGTGGEEEGGEEGASGDKEGSHNTCTHPTHNYNPLSPILPPGPHTSPSSRKRFKPNLGRCRSRKTSECESTWNSPLLQETGSSNSVAGPDLAPLPPPLQFHSPAAHSPKCSAPDPPYEFSDFPKSAFLPCLPSLSATLPASPTGGHLSPIPHLQGNPPLDSVAPPACTHSHYSLPPLPRGLDDDSTTNLASHLHTHSPSHLLPTTQYSPLSFSPQTPLASHCHHSLLDQLYYPLYIHRDHNLISTETTTSEKTEDHESSSVLLLDSEPSEDATCMEPGTFEAFFSPSHTFTPRTLILNGKRKRPFSPLDPKAKLQQNRTCKKDEYGVNVLKCKVPISTKYPKYKDPPDPQNINNTGYLAEIRKLEELNKVEVTFPQQAENATIAVHSSYMFKCSNFGHIWHIKHYPKPTDYKCLKCRKAYLKCKNIAIQKNGKLLSTELEKELQFECQAKHIWTTPYNKYVNQKWCPKCSQIRKTDKKLKLQQENEELQSFYKKKQNELFEEAKKKMKIEREKTDYNQMLQGLFDFSDYGSNYYLEGPPCMNMKQTANSVEFIENQIDTLAQDKAKKYMSDPSYTGHSSFQALIFLYKIVLTSHQLIEWKFKKVERKERESMYRKMAILIHPDKNRHPLALEGFQKLLTAYQRSKRQA